MIEVKNATLQYTTFKRSQGLKGVMHDFFKRSVIQVEALSDISLTINEGEMIGLIGRNGAGKTTLIKLLTGILPLRQGVIKIDQMLPYQREKVFLKNIGVLLGQRSQLIWDLPAIDTYDMLAAIYELPKQMYNARLSWLSEQLEVTELLYIPVRKLSLGQRVKCELIAALLHRPKYLFLDEPTLGLDFVTQKTIYKILRLENQYHKTTIITTSHYIKDIEQLADKVIILNKGKIIFTDKLEQLPKELTTEILFDIDFLNSKSVEKKLTCAPDKLNEILAKIPAERILRVSQRGMELEELILQFIKGDSI